jgi:carbon starvation protein
MGAGAVISKPWLWLADASAIEQKSIVTFCTSFIAVVVISFAMTTLDSATRLLRFNVEELGKVLRFAPLRNRYVASGVAVAAIAWFAFVKVGGKPAGATLWQLFGTTNQLLASIGLLVVSVMLYKMHKPIVFTVIPMLIMIASVAWAMVYKLDEFYAGWRERGDRGSMFLFLVGAALLALSVWLLVEAVLAFRRYQTIRAEGGDVRYCPNPQCGYGNILAAVHCARCRQPIEQ